MTALEFSGWFIGGLTTLYAVACYIEERWKR